MYSVVVAMRHSRQSTRWS